MIASLAIENIALIQELRIELEEGLNVLTGETGAGKSIIVDAMNLALGERAEKSLIRHGAESARVEALLYADSPKTRRVLEELGIPPEEEIVVERTLSAAGRSRCRVNGRSVTLSSLKQLMDTLVDLHGQHEHQSLLYPANHVELLDQMIRSKTEPVRDKIRREYERLRKETRELGELGGSAEERADALDLLSFQTNELEEARVDPGELQRLYAEQERIEKAADMDRDVHLAYAAVFEGADERDSALSALQAGLRRLEKYPGLDERLDGVVDSMREAYYSLEDIAPEFSLILDNLFVDDERRHIVEERIDELDTLLRKYRVSSEEELLERLAAAREKLETLQGADARSKELSASIDARKKTLRGLYEELSRLRRQAADRLSKGLLRELKDLGMADARFEVAFSELPENYGPTSPEEAEFMISVNAGEPLKPLSKVASGGEMSRIMLAFKVLTAEHDGIDTLIFDEVDTGISGRVAQIVAEKMSRIARSRQVITVSHLPQIAAAGDQNFYIHKESTGDRTNTYVEALDEAGRRGEVARLAGGLDSASAQAHAQEMIDNARAFKARAKERNAKSD